MQSALNKEFNLQAYEHGKKKIMLLCFFADCYTRQVSLLPRFNVLNLLVIPPEETITCAQWVMIKRPWQRTKRPYERPEEGLLLSRIALLCLVCIGLPLYSKWIEW